MVAVLSLIGGVALTWADPGDPMGLFILLIGPVSGLAVFQRLFRRTGRWKGIGFWVVAPLAIVAVLLLLRLFLALFDPAAMPLWLVLVLPVLALFLLGVAILLIWSADD